jgi:hypothetical protein
MVGLLLSRCREKCVSVAGLGSASIPVHERRQSRVPFFLVEGRFGRGSEAACVGRCSRDASRESLAERLERRAVSPPL